MHCRRKVEAMLGGFLFRALVAEAFFVIGAVVKNLCVSEKIASKVEGSQVWAIRCAGDALIFAVVCDYQADRVKVFEDIQYW